MAHKIRELRVPVYPPPRSGWAGRDVPAAIEPTEYWIVEEWTDGTMRHPLLGTAVTRELWETERESATRFLRTGEP